MKLGKYSIGVGDRFAHQGEAQLQAVIKAFEQGVEITPIWNKSHREHTIIHTQPADVRRSADNAVKALRWTKDYFVDADHVGLPNVDLFIESSDFFTLDVADFIGKPADEQSINTFVQANEKYTGRLEIPGIEEPQEITSEIIRQIGTKFLYAVQQAGQIYRRVLARKGPDNFIVEVSMDETDEPQTPIELFFILAAVAQEGIPAQTIAPKFAGRFNKGVDYVGNVAQFAREFQGDLAVIQLAIQEFDLPDNLKLSVHSGSDKFSIYPAIREALVKFDAGVHLKTAGTTWLEELIGLALAGGDGLKLACDVYRQAYQRFDELTRPYAAVIDINPAQLPLPTEVDRWDRDQFASTLRHNLNHPHYNLHFRQVLHVGYKVAAEMGERYLEALKKYKASIAPHVTENIYDRHLKPIFLS